MAADLEGRLPEWGQFDVQYLGVEVDIIEGLQHIRNNTRKKSYMLLVE